MFVYLWQNEHVIPSIGAFVVHFWHSTFVKAIVVVRGPVEDRLPIVGYVQFGESVELSSTTFIVANDFSHFGGGIAQLLEEEQGTGSVLNKIEIVHVEGLVLDAHGKAVDDLVVVIEHVRRAVDAINHGELLLAVHGADADVMLVKAVEHGSAAPDQLTFAIVEMRTDPSVARFDLG